MFRTHLTHESDLVLPATAFQEKDGTTVNLEGRLQRMTVGASPRGGIKPELSWISGLARRLGATVPGHAAGAFRVAAKAVGAALPVSSHADIPEGGMLGVGGSVLARPVTPPAVAPREGELVLQVAPVLYDGTDVTHAKSMAFLQAQHTVTMARADAASRGLSRGDEVVVSVDGATYRGTVAVSRRQGAGTARLLAGTCGAPAGRTGYHAASVERAPASTPCSAATAPASS